MMGDMKRHSLLLSLTLKNIRKMQMDIEY